MGYRVDVAVITETNLKKHLDHHFSVDVYVMFRPDRVWAVYVSNRTKADVWAWPCDRDSSQFEMFWVRVQTQMHSTFVGALYHPPRPQYQPAALLDYIEAGVDAVTAMCPSATNTIVQAGDMLQYRQSH